MKIDGVPAVLRNPLLKKILRLIEKGTHIDRREEETVRGDVSIGATRFRRWVEIILEYSHNGELPHNFSIVDDLESVYRGGYPTKETVQGLKDLGINHVVSLWDNGNERENRVMQKGSYELKEAGLEQLVVPLKRSEVINNDLLGKKIFDLSQEIETLEGGVYIHCENGARRTGYVVAGLRLLKNNFSLTPDDSSEWDRYRSYGDVRMRGFQELGFNRKMIDLFHVLMLSKAREEKDEESIYYYSGVMECDRNLYKGLAECHPFAGFINRQMGE